MEKRSLPRIKNINLMENSNEKKYNGKSDLTFRKVIRHSYEKRKKIVSQRAKPRLTAMPSVLSDVEISPAIVFHKDSDGHFSREPGRISSFGIIFSFIFTIDSIVLCSLIIY